MSVINGAAFGCDLSQFDHLFGLRVTARRVIEARGQSERAVVHSLADERFHLFELFRRRGGVAHSHHRLPDGAVADERRDVRAYALRFQLLKSFGEWNATASVIAYKNSCHALRQVREIGGALRIEEVVVGVRVRIDESWRDD